MASLGGERVFIIEEKIQFKGLTNNITNLRIWLPYPANDDWQVVNDFVLSGPLKNSFLVDKEYGNRIIYLEAKDKQLAQDASSVILNFKIKRRESKAYLNSAVNYKVMSRFLKADRLVPVNGYMKKLAKDLTKDKASGLEKVRVIYDYLIDTLDYSKDNPEICGIGDSYLTLKHKKGICTDYHSLFISLVRSLGIPAKFEIGFRLPEGIPEGRLNGYHCWAKFYLKDKGWIPVDISEADKHPERRDYFFGHIDENRVHFTTGRDIRLKYAKASPFNFFIYPYIELNGRQFKDMDIEITYKEVGDEKNI